MVPCQHHVICRIISSKMILTEMHVKISAVKHRPGARNDTPSPKPRRSDASESGEIWLLNMHLCAYQKGLEACCYTSNNMN